MNMKENTKPQSPEKLTCSTAHHHFHASKFPNTIFSVIKFTSHHHTINSDYCFKINISCNSKLHLNTMLNSIGTLTFEQTQQTTYFHGIISEIVYYKCIDGIYFYEITLHSPLHFLSQRQTNRVFVNKQCLEIIKFIFSGHPEINLHLRIKVNKTLPKLAFRTQFKESDLHFLQRLLADHELYLYIQQSKHSYQIIIQGKPNSIEDHTIKTLETRNSIFKPKLSCTTISSNSPLFPGYYFYDQPHQLIISVQHDMPSRNDYRCQATLIPKNTLFNNLHTKKAKRFGLYPATIHSQDPQGRYYVYVDFDTIANNLCGPIDALTPHGIQQPLIPNSRVCLQFIDGDMDQPIIVGAISNENHPSPVTHRNPTQNIISTHYGHAFVMDDKKGQQKIQLYTKNQTQQLILDAKQCGPSISIINTHGDIEFYSQQDINIRCQHNYHSHAESLKITVGDNYRSHVNKGTIYFRAGINISLLTKLDHIIKANAIAINSCGKQHYNAKYNITIKADKNCYILARTGDLLLNVLQTINITSSYQGSLLLGSTNAFIRSNNAKLELHANSIVLHTKKLDFLNATQLIN